MNSSFLKSQAVRAGIRLPVLLSALTSVGSVQSPLAADVSEPLPDVVQLSDEEAAIENQTIRDEVSVTLMDGFELKLWASPKLLGDPTALDIDGRGRAFVTQTRRRRGQGEIDIRNHPDWMTPSLSWTTVEDRRAFYLEQLSPERSDRNEWMPDLNRDGSHDWRDLTAMKERVLQIEDTTGDGTADRTQVFFEGFHEVTSDVAGGVLRHEDSVYVAVSPDLWRLRDTTGDGRADARESIAHGFGVHTGFAGHGLSGVTLGPDGRIYWAIGDNGAHVTGKDGREWAYPNTGIIARAEPDGSGFEVFAWGLRNTHEIAFDEFGNLISVDNDGDHQGEHERIVYLIWGSDSGWRTNWQYGKYDAEDNNSYKVWMDEELFRPRLDGQAAYVLPPVAAFRSGPSGVTYNPGTALSGRWKDFVFVSQFTGSLPNSKITGFRFEEEGAGFRLAEQHDILSGLMATSLAFGPDGALYFTDWVEGWALNGEGRIWKLDTSASAGSDLRKSTEALLGENFGAHAMAVLGELLEHDDMRVRQKAQFALVDRGNAGARTLLGVVRESDRQLARIHGLWGLGQLIREGGDYAEAVAEFLTDDDAEVRAQAAKVLGDVRYAAAVGRLLPLLEDDAARVRFFAAEALGRIGEDAAVDAIAEMLVANDDRDVYLRHAGAIALAGIGDADRVTSYSDHESRALRIAAVMALRRMRDPGVAKFLSDEDEYIVTEAARAINDDRSIPAALPALSRVLEDPRFRNEPLLRRAINANLRIGGSEEAQRVASYAARADAPEAMRIEALESLAVWSQPSIFDRVDGRYRGSSERNPEIARNALAQEIEPILNVASNASVQAVAIEVAGRLELREVAPRLLEILRDSEVAELRAAALVGLEGMRSSLLGEAVRTALGDPDEGVRRSALRMARALDDSEGELVGMLARLAETGSEGERQTAVEVLGRLRNDRSRIVLDQFLDKLIEGDVDPEIQLEVVEAVGASEDERLLKKLARHQEAKREEGPVAAYAESLHGGNIREGRRLFRENPSVSCTQCHSIQGAGGSAGPDLTHVGGRLSREMLLQSLVDPSARIAPGFGIVVLTLKNGETAVGTLVEETDNSLKMNISGATKEYRRSEIAAREDAPSSMPPMGSILTSRQLRDLVEYLASLQ